MESILKGLEYLHANKVAHRSLRPSNIYVSQNGMCKIADFGQIKEHCKTNLKASDIYWTAPEVVYQTTTVSRHSDIWSFGCIILELVSG